MEKSLNIDFYPAIVPISGLEELNIGKFILEEKLDGSYTFLYFPEEVRKFGYIYWGENLSICHTMRYQAPAPIIVFDVGQLERKEIIKYPEKLEIILKSGFIPAPIVRDIKNYSGKFFLGYHPDAPKDILEGVTFEGFVIKDYENLRFYKWVNPKHEEARKYFDFRRRIVRNKIVPFNFRRFKEYWNGFEIEASYHDFIRYQRRLKFLEKILLRT